MSEVKVDTISERTAANGVAVDGVTIKDSGLTIPSGGTLTVASGGTITNSGTATGFSSGDNTPSFEATVGAEQTSLSEGVYHKIAFNTEVFDVGSNYDHTTNYRFVAPETAKYFFYSQNRVVADDGAGKLIETIYNFYVNGSGSDYWVYNDYRNGNTLSITVQNCGIIPLSASDYVEVYCNCDLSSGTWTLQNNASQFFCFKMIGL